MDSWKHVLVQEGNFKNEEVPQLSLVENVTFQLL